MTATLEDTAVAEEVAEEQEVEPVPQPKIRHRVKGSSDVEAAMPIMLLKAGYNVEQHAKDRQGRWMAKYIPAKLLYFEAISTSASIVNALAAAVTEPDQSGKWLVKRKLPDQEYIGETEVTIPTESSLRTSGILLDEHTPRLHHLAFLARDARLLLSRSDTELWEKLRRAMTVPTKSAWGLHLMPQVRLADLLEPLEVYGWPQGMQAWYLREGAQEAFDGIVSSWVARHGLEAA